MEKEQGKFEQLFHDAYDYIDAKQQLLKLQLVEKTSRVAAGILSFIIIMPFFILAFLFISFSLAQVFAELWGHQWLGYLSITLIYLFIGLVLVVFRKKLLIRPIMNKFIKQILSKD